jgi:O-acetyl-ADP-ribose deacetylase (regulator of RNase III)
MTRHPSNTFTVAPGITVGCITADSITTVATDGIVNAANERLRGGSGVNGAIHADGGPDIMAECNRLGGCEPGQAKSTTAGMLPARRVIHAVGPRYYAVTPEEAARLLASAYTVSLEVAARDGLARVTLPSLSTGSFDYPVEEAARVGTRAVVGYLRAHAGPDAVVREVRWVLRPNDTTAPLDVYASALHDAVSEVAARDA